MIQLGKRVRQLEHAQLAADRQRIRTQTETAGINIESDGDMGMNLDVRYEVPNSWTDPVNIYSFVRTHHGDPAITVRLPSER